MAVSMPISNRVSFLGLDELTFKVAASLIQSGYEVYAYEILEPLMNRFLELNGRKCANISDAVRDAAAVFMSQSLEGIHRKNCEKAIRDDLWEGGIAIVLTTSSSSYLEGLKELVTGPGTNRVVDAYAFKGGSKSSTEKTVVTLSGRAEVLAKAQIFLSDAFSEIYILEGEAGAASKAGMVIELLQGIHLVASLEAMFLGTVAGSHPKIIYDIISTAAGNSWVFENFVPELLSEEYKETDFWDDLAQNVGHVLHVAQSLTFPLPILALAHQQLICGSLHTSRISRSHGLYEVWKKHYGVNLKKASSSHSYCPGDLGDVVIGTAHGINKVGFIGLGAMGFGMATNLLKSKFHVTGFDVYAPSVFKFTVAGGLAGNSPAEISKDADVLVLMVANEGQVNATLFGDAGSVAVLPCGATIILSSTVSPGFVVDLERRLQDSRKDLKLVDAPVSGGVKRAADGTLTIMAAGTEEALRHAGSILSAMSEHLYVIEGGCGAGSSVKMINQLLAGIHIAASAEAIAFGACLGLNARALFNIVKSSRGTSWMFENRVPHMLDDDYSPYSALDIFVKDLGIVVHEGSTHRVALSVSSIAHQQFLAGSASGWGRLDDSAVVKVYEKITGVKVNRIFSNVKRQDIFDSLPPEWPEDPVECIRKLNSEDSSRILVVLDDDPTGTQTVHDVDVLMDWSVGALVEEFKKKPSCFFILTNSRSLSSVKAFMLIKDICSNVEAASRSVQSTGYTIVLRGDSTLRGHFPEEADAVVSELGQMDAWVIFPFFLQGGRYTIGNVHYVAHSEMLIPAGLSEFAKDASFGYNASDLREWVEEKTKGRVPSENVACISIELLRTGGPLAVCNYLCSLPKGSVCIVNSAGERDLLVFALGVIEAEKLGKRFLCRTAASFVSARIGITCRMPISPVDFGIQKGKNGALIVAGSYVPKTTRQIDVLMKQLGHTLKCVEVAVHRIALKSVEERKAEINSAAEKANVFLAAKWNTLIVTSRKLITGKTPAESLEINSSVSTALVEIVKQIDVRPRYILSKGGITSSDMASSALGAKNAKVLGQALAGVPLWRLGPESKHPGVPFIVFPGNVGDDDSLADVVMQWSRPFRTSSMKDLLHNAKVGQYAVGAFNVYNLEGVEAVVDAAEEEKSPAILQIHPAALKVAGSSLIACCVSAAENSTVPIIVHFDHGCSRHELLWALEMGFDSVMVDGSHLSLEENILLTRYISNLAHSRKMSVEAELGRLSGTEDDMAVSDYDARLTDVAQASQFMDDTAVDALAVCIGNVHGKYPTSGPSLRLDLLKELNEVASKRGVNLVLHGASGLPTSLVLECIRHGVTKFNVNTEVRNACLEALQGSQKDLTHTIASAKDAMKAVIVEKMQLFGSAGKG